MFPPRLINAFPWSAGLGSKPLKMSSICYWGRNFLRKSSPCSPPCLFLVLWHMSNFHWTILQLLLAIAGLWVHQNGVAEKKCCLEKVCVSSSPSWLSLLFCVSDTFWGFGKTGNHTETKELGVFLFYFLRYIQCGCGRWASLWLLLQWWDESEVSVNCKCFTRGREMHTTHPPLLVMTAEGISVCAGEGTVHPTSPHPEPVLILQTRPSLPLAHLIEQIQTQSFHFLPRLYLFSFSYLQVCLLFALISQ